MHIPQKHSAPEGNQDICWPMTLGIQHVAQVLGSKISGALAPVSKHAENAASGETTASLGPEQDQKQRTSSKGHAGLRRAVYISS